MFERQLTEALQPLESDDVFVSELISRELSGLSDDQLRRVALNITMGPLGDDRKAAIEILREIYMNGFSDKSYKEMTREELMREISETLNEFRPDDIIAAVREYAKG